MEEIFNKFMCFKRPRDKCCGLELQRTLREMKRLPAAPAQGPSEALVPSAPMAGQHGQPGWWDLWSAALLALTLGALGGDTECSGAPFPSLGPVPFSAHYRLDQGLLGFCGLQRVGCRVLCSSGTTAWL